MDDDKPSLIDALRRLAEQKRRSLPGHPTPQELAAYHAGELPPEAEARLREHLAVCPECSDLLLDLAGFADLKPPEGVPELTDDEVEQDWQALRARMGEGGEGKKTAPVVPIRPGGVPRRRRFDSPLLPVAASLLAVLGFSFGLYQSVQVGRLSRDLRHLRQPSVEVIIDPAIGMRGGEGTSVPGTMSSRTGGVVFLYPTEDSSSYGVEITRGTEVVWSATVPGGEARPDAVPVDIPGGFLVPGTYNVSLYADEAREEPQAEVDLEVK